MQLLATTAQLVGEEPGAGGRPPGLSADDLVELLAFLEPTALTGAAKRHVTDTKKPLTGLREAGAALTGVEPPEADRAAPLPAQLGLAGRRVRPRRLPPVGQLAGVAAMGDIFEGAIWGWVLLTFVIAQLPQISQSVAMLGAVSARLPFGPVIGVQFANAFTGLVGGTAGNATLVIRFFQKQGLPPAVAASSGILTSVSGFIVQAVLIVLGIAVTGSEFDLVDRQRRRRHPRLAGRGDRRPGGGRGRPAARSQHPQARPRYRRDPGPSGVGRTSAASSPPRGRPCSCSAGTSSSQVLYAMVLGAALHAYGGSLPLLQLVVINCVASFVGGTAPVPGGMGVIETGLIAGFTASGIPEAEAVAATFTAADVHVLPAARSGAGSPCRGSGRRTTSDVAEHLKVEP